MELTTGKRVVAALFSAIVPGSGQLLKGEMKKGTACVAAFGLLVLLYWPIRVPETYLGLVVVKIGEMCLSLIASLDAWLTGAKGTPRYLVIFPIVAALLLGDVATSITFLAEGFHVLYVPSSAMEPSVMVGDRVVADEHYYETRAPQRGDIVLLNYNVLTMKRVVAVEDDVIEGSGDKVWLNGKLLQEPYVQHTSGSVALRRSAFGPVRVLRGKLFLMGDNRDFSLDSREPSFGQMSVQAVLGRVLYVYVSRTPRRWGRKIE